MYIPYAWLIDLWMKSVRWSWLRASRPEREKLRFVVAEAWDLIQERGGGWAVSVGGRVDEVCGKRWRNLKDESISETGEDSDNKAVTITSLMLSLLFPQLDTSLLFPIKRTLPDFQDSAPHTKSSIKSSDATLLSSFLPSAPHPEQWRKASSLGKWQGSPDKADSSPAVGGVRGKGNCCYCKWKHLLLWGHSSRR